MVEQLTLNQLVLGSSPSRGTISSQIYKISALFNQGAFCFRDPFHLPAFNFTPNNTDPSSDSFAKPNPKPTPQRRLTHPPDHTDPPPRRQSRPHRAPSPRAVFGLLSVPQKAKNDRIESRPSHNRP